MGGNRTGCQARQSNFLLSKNNTLFLSFPELQNLPGKLNDLASAILQERTRFSSTDILLFQQMLYYKN